ncbi:MAG: signal peptidase II [Candidatus Omnitrophica bacterium CG1_02_46_14]|nr:MAG: signal peptidase II [Candidatus Omnitrophica bacterium CG1_02_46_14]
MKKVFLFLITSFLFVLDRLSKLLAVASLSEGESRPVWLGVFHLTRVNNTGAAFGMLKQNTGLLTLISIVCVVGITGILVKDFSKKSPSGRARVSKSFSLRNLALAMIAAGAAGNLYDRIRYGYVIDFLDFRVWPVFNIADSSICIGIFLMIVSLYKIRNTA